MLELKKLNTTKKVKDFYMLNNIVFIQNMDGHFHLGIEEGTIIKLPGKSTARIDYIKSIDHKIYLALSSGESYLIDGDSFIKLKDYLFLVDDKHNMHRLNYDSNNTEIVNMTTGQTKVIFDRPLYYHQFNSNKEFTIASYLVDKKTKHMVCINLPNGEILWDKPLAQHFNVHGVWNDQIICTSSRETTTFIEYIDKDSGDINYRFELPKNEVLAVNNIGNHYRTFYNYWQLSLTKNQLINPYATFNLVNKSLEIYPRSDFKNEIYNRHQMEQNWNTLSEKYLFTFVSYKYPSHNKGSKYGFMTEGSLLVFDLNDNKLVYKKILPIGQFGISKMKFYNNQLFILDSKSILTAYQVHDKVSTN